MPEPYLQDPDVTLYCGDALETLRQLPDRSVHMCATSPPFYGLRDYGTGTWEGGDEGCDHIAPTPGGPSEKQESSAGTRGLQYRSVCGKCGARRIDNQIGLESSPDEWVARLVEVFREVRRVLRDDGTLWVEIGDSYCGSMSGSTTWINEANGKRNIKTQDLGRRVQVGGKPKDLLGQPWLLAFALRADGWYLRSEIIWARPNPMPESVTDRPTKAHSTVFLLSKMPRYYFDAEAIREPHQHDGRKVTHVQQGDGSIQHRNGERWPGTGANARSVWVCPTEPTPFAHFATWPQALVRRMILAGTSERGVCPECGGPWVREVAESDEYARKRVQGGWRTDEAAPLESGHRKSGVALTRDVVTLGWRPSCDCKSPGLQSHPEVRFCQGCGYAVDNCPTACPTQGAPAPIPATILDPFAGSGTTLLVARKLGRHSIGIELNPDYCALTDDRLRQQSLFTEELMA